MKKNIILILIIAINFFSTNINAQTLGAYLTNMRVNQQLVTSNYPIDVGINDFKDLTFRCGFTKFSGSDVPSVTVNVSVYNSSGGKVTEYFNESKSMSLSDTGTYVDTYKTLYASSVNYDGTNYIQCRVYQNNSPNVWYSEKYYVKKTPTYTLTSNSTNVLCGTTTPARFTANSAAASGNSYNWSIGAGWSYNGYAGPLNVGSTGTNYIDVVPTSGTLGQVTCVASFQGVVVTTLGATLNYEPFTSAATISGNTSICSLGTTTNYTINAGLGNTVTWSSSNTAKATVGAQSSNQVTLTSVTNGILDLIATITNPCGQTTSVKKIINIGLPSVAILKTVLTGQNIVRLELYGVGNINVRNLGITNVSWELLSSIPASCGALPNQNSFVNYLDYTGNCNSTIKVTVTTSCGVKSYSTTVNAQSGIVNRIGNPNTIYKISPNPSSDIITVELNNSGNLKSNDSSFEKVNKFDNKSPTASLFDMYGLLKDRFIIIDGKANLDVKKYPKGVYFLKINNNGIEENHQIIVE
jgi:hypothetical protein